MNTFSSDGTTPTSSPSSLRSQSAMTSDSWATDVLSRISESTLVAASGPTRSQSPSDPLRRSRSDPSSGSFSTVQSARGTPKGPLPIEFQINLLKSVLEHDPFNCPIRKTAQVWEVIAQEQGIRARTCARRFDNIVQGSIAGRERLVGTEEQKAIKEGLLERLYEMMNQPSALDRMQKKRRYRSEEADRRLLAETIRVNPFDQKIGQVARAWEDIRDALQMKAHSRQCIRRLNRIVKAYHLRERMYNGDIPDEMKEVNDDLVKQVVQLMGHSGGGSLDEASSNAASQDEEEDDDDGDEEDDEILSCGSDSDHLGDSMLDVGGSKRAVGEKSLKELEQPNPTAIWRLHRPSDLITVTTSRYPSQSSRQRTNSHPGERQQAPASALTTLPEQTSKHPSQNESLDQRDLKRPFKVARSNDRTMHTIGCISPRPPPEQVDPKSGWPILSPTSSSSSTVFTSPVPSNSGIYQAKEAPTQHGHFPAMHNTSTLLQGPSPSVQLYRAVLSEFQVVRGFLNQIDAQRQRDQETQLATLDLVRRLERQVRQQQEHIHHLEIRVGSISQPRSAGELDTSLRSAGLSHEIPEGMETTDCPQQVEARWEDDGVRAHEIDRLRGGLR